MSCKNTSQGWQWPKHQSKVPPNISSGTSSNRTLSLAQRPVLDSYMLLIFHPCLTCKTKSVKSEFLKTEKIAPNTAYQHTLVLGINISFCRYYSKVPGVFVSCKISCDFLFVWLPCSSKAPQSPLWNKCSDLWENICL